MKNQTYQLKASMWVNLPLEETYSFFDKAENLQKITPEHLSFKILTPAPITMQTGTIIDYLTTIAGIPMRWTSSIQEYDAPHSFIDTQLKGPYSFWHHEHRFEAHEGGTLITDTVHYLLPMGIFGRIAHALFVKKQLHTIFDYRNKKVCELFDAPLDKTTLEFN